MIQTITVLLYGRPIGALRLLENGYCDFEYTDAFRASGLQPSPLMMPTNGRRVYSFPNLSRDTFNGLPGMGIIKQKREPLFPSKIYPVSS